MDNPVYNKLNAYQKDIYDEYMEKNDNFAINIPMGGGKTLLALVIALEKAEANGLPILVVCSKTLILNWINEITKHFGDSLKYEVVSPSYTKDIKNWKINPATKLVIVNPESLSRVYKAHNLQSHIIWTDIINRFQLCTHYTTVHDPIMPSSAVGLLSIYSIHWSTLIIDEFQGYCNLRAGLTRSIIAIAARHRCGLSGTPIGNPKKQVILGLYRLIDNSKYPVDCIETLKDMIWSKEYKGLNDIFIVRDAIKTENTGPSLKMYIVKHDIAKEEDAVYKVIRQSLRETMAEIKRLQEQRNRDNDTLVQLRTGLLSSIVRLRQSITCSFIPIASLSISVADHTHNNLIANKLNDSIKKADIDDWMNNIENIKSTRIRSILSMLDAHKDEKVVLFNSFRSCIDLLIYFITDREIFTIASSMNISQRQKVIEDFSKSNNGVLLLTYKLGSTGLNLQAAHICFITDMTFDEKDTSQAIARIYRQGQTANLVKIYFFTSNYGMEQILLIKQSDKKKYVDSLLVGPIRSSIKPIRMREIISNIVNTEDNIKIIKEITNVNMEIHEIKK